MHFEGRELKPYAEPVSKSELREGETYFAVNYVDNVRNKIITIQGFEIPVSSSYETAFFKRFNS